MKLGIAIFPADYAIRPDELARAVEAHALRVALLPEEIANHGIDPPTRWAVMDERVQAMRVIWTQEEAEFHGRHVDFDPIGSSRTRRGPTGATPTSPSPSRAPSPTLAR